MNTGNKNSGNYNSGNYNSGGANSGDGNSGHYNTGNYNNGNWNSGSWNIGSYNTGYFCIETPTLTFFDKETALCEIDNILGIQVMSDAPTKVMWIRDIDMTNEEKESGYLKVLSYKELKEKRQKWYSQLSNKDKQAILNLPNFDAEKFKKCTMIDVNEELQNKIVELKKLKGMVK